MEELITVYLITRNRLVLLKRAINSVLIQHNVKFELIVVDNASTDKTNEYMQDLMLIDNRIKYILLENNMGACYARNLAIELANGKFITGMDDDDYFTPNRLSILLSKYKLNLDSAFVYGDDALINGSEIITKTNKPKRITAELMKYQNLVGNQIFAEKNKFLKVNCFDETLLAAQDYDIWFRMLLEFGDAVKAEGVSQYLETGNHQRISTSKNKFIGYSQFYKKHKKNFNRSQRKHQLLNIKYACRNRMSLRTFIILFDCKFLKRKVKVFLTRVLKQGSYDY